MGAMNNIYDVVVIGGGIIGCATAMQVLSESPGIKLLLLEKESELGKHQSSHNSGVIHSGLYYKPGSLKAINCRNGYRYLMDFCEREQVNHEICGKIVVATSQSEIPRLEELYRRGKANGLKDLQYLTPDAIREHEPHCTGVKGLYVPETGIIDYGSLTNTYGDKIREKDGQIQFNCSVEDLQQKTSYIDVVIKGRQQSIRAKKVIACAGLYSDRLARKIEADLPSRIIPFRGEYYKLKPSARSLVKNLIYPVPDPAFPFLGVHFTRLISGDVECGPNAVFAFGREAYHKSNINISDTLEAISWGGFRHVIKKYWKSGMGEFYRSFSKQAFVKALQKLVPKITPDALEPGGAGIRAQACDRGGRLIDDFNIRRNGNIIHVCNMPSPAATASLSIGAHLAQQIK